MTLKDYEFLISTMEKIVSLDIKSSALNDEKKEIISKKTILEDDISSITNRIEELQRRKNSTDNPDSLSGVFIEQGLLISKNRQEIKELKSKISKLDSKTRSRTMGKTYGEWEESRTSIIDELGISTAIGAMIFLPVSLAFFIFTESIGDTVDEYFWYLVASFCVPFLLFFGLLSVMRIEDKKNMPILADWENQRKSLVSDLEEINEITNEKIRANNVLNDTIIAYESFEKNLKEEDEKLESLRVPLRERLSEIEAIEVELSRINDEIVNSLESVAHLTPYNSGL